MALRIILVITTAVLCLVPEATIRCSATDMTMALGAAPDEAPINDEPCGAIPLQIVNGCMPRRYVALGATTSDTSSPGAISVPAPCNGAIPNNDVWFTALVPANGELRLEMEATTLTDAALAIYTAAGNCAEGTLSLNLVACATDGSTYDEAMPLITATGLAPNSIVYVRVWQESDEEGDVLVCAGRTFLPNSNCLYLFEFETERNDGWGPHTLTINGMEMPAGGNSELLYFNGSRGFSYFYLGTNFFNDSWFLFSFNGPISIFDSIHWSMTSIDIGELLIDRNGISDIQDEWIIGNSCRIYNNGGDCIGSIHLCDSLNYDELFYGTSQDLINDLNIGNSGCMATSSQNGTWFRLRTYGNGSLAFTLTPTDPEADINWALWGPTSDAWECDLSTTPLRCSVAAVSGTTGINASATDLTEDESGDGWLSPIASEPFSYYDLYVEYPSTLGSSFTITFQNEPSDLVNCEGLPTGVSQRVERTTSLAPNPAHTTLTLQPGHHTPYHWQLLDARGQLLRTGTHRGDLTLPVDELPQGMYVLRSGTDTGATNEHRWVKE
jgi:hypothetical protein